MDKFADYQPTRDEVRTALRGLLEIVRGSNAFKIGRCNTDDFNALEHRDMYGECERVSRIWTGPPHKVEWLERRLTELARKHWPARCYNEQAGGGPMADDGSHCVYVVEWKPTIERQVDIFYWLATQPSPNK